MTTLTRRLPVVALALLTVLGTATAASAGGTGPAGRSCSDRSLLFCEDFEKLPTGGAASLNWGIDTKHGTLTVERARHGDKVLRVHTEGNGRAFLRVDDFAAPTAGFYGRVRLRVDAFPTAPDWAHFTLVEATGSGSSEVVRPVGGQWAPPLSKSYWGIGADGGPTGDWTNWTEEAPTVPDRWQCVEWQLSTVDNRVTVWFDGKTSPALTVDTDTHGGNPVDFVLPKVDTLKVGWQLYQGGPTPAAFDVWVDDLALSAKRIGC